MMMAKSMTRVLQAHRSGSSATVASDSSGFSRARSASQFHRDRQKFKLTIETPIVIPVARKSTESEHRRMDDEQHEWQGEVLRERQVKSKRTSIVVPQEEWFFVRVYAAMLLNSTGYRALMASVIIFNFVAVIMETNVRAQLEEDEELPVWLWRTTQAFLMLYVTEVLARLYVVRWDYFSSVMNMFDAGIVVMDISAEIASRVVGDLPSISVLRVLRILRIVRVLRQFLIFRELYLMLQGLVSALRAFVFATGMILVVLINWGILAVELIHETNVELAAEGAYGDCERCRRAFGSVQNAVFTFIKTIIAGDSWGQIALPIMERKPWTATIIISALLTVQLGLLNLIVAIIVDRAAQARREDEELMHQLKEEEFVNSFDRLLRLFNSMDNDHSGNLTVDEIQIAYETHPEFAAIMKLMDIGREDMEICYEIMDHDKSGAVEYKEFVQQLHTMRTYDEHTLLIFVRHTVDVIRAKVEEQHRKLSDKFDVQDRLLHDVVDALRSGGKMRTPGDDLEKHVSFTEVYKDEPPPQEPRAPRMRQDPDPHTVTDKISAQADEMHRDLQRELQRAQRRASVALDTLAADFITAVTAPRLLALSANQPAEPLLLPRNTSARDHCGFPGCRTELAASRKPLQFGPAERGPREGARKDCIASSAPAAAPRVSGTPQNGAERQDAPGPDSAAAAVDARPGRYSMDAAGALRWQLQSVPEATKLNGDSENASAVRG